MQTCTHIYSQAYSKTSFPTITQQLPPLHPPPLPLTYLSLQANGVLLLAGRRRGPRRGLGACRWSFGHRPNRGGSPATSAVILLLIISFHNHTYHESESFMPITPHHKYVIPYYGKLYHTVPLNTTSHHHLSHPTATCQLVLCTSYSMPSTADCPYEIWSMVYW